MGTDLGGLAEGGVRGRWVVVEALDRGRHQQPPTLHAVEVALLEMRWARASQPPPWAISPINNSTVPSRKAHRAAPTESPRRTHSWWARPHESVLSMSRPTRNAAIASRSRSSSPSGASWSATDNRAYASPHACRPKDARPPSSACSSSAMPIGSPTSEGRHRGSASMPDNRPQATHPTVRDIRSARYHSVEPDRGCPQSAGRGHSRRKGPVSGNAVSGTTPCGGSEGIREAPDAACL